VEEKEESRKLFMGMKIKVIIGGNMKVRLFYSVVGSLLWSASLAQPGAFSLIYPPNGGWVTATPCFSWGSSTGATYYRLFIDGVLKKDSIATTQYCLQTGEAIAEGLHTWYVRARNASAQETQSTQTWSIQVDATLPSAFNLSAPPDLEWTSNVRPTFQWTASSDVPSGLRKYQLVIDGSVAVDSIPISSTTRTSPSDLSTGSHTWQVRAMDIAGNVRTSTQTWMIRIDDLGPLGSTNPVYSGSTNGHSIFIPNSPSLTMNGTITIEAWVKHTGTGGDQFIVAKSACCSPTGFEMKMVGNSASRRIQCGFGRISGISPVMQSTSILAPNTWYHVAVTLGNGGFSIYINGLLDNYQNVTVGNFSQTTSDMRIGASTYVTDPTSSFVGEIDEVRLWNIVRSQSDISRNMRRALRGDEAGLVGYWRMNDGGSSFVSDLSSSQNHGTLTNGASFVNSTLRGGNLSLDAVPLVQPTNYSFNVSPIIFTWHSLSDAGIGFSKYQLFVDGILRIDNLQDTSVSVGPFSYGQHRWHVVGIDLLGNVQPSPVRIFYLDSAPPFPFNLVSPAEGQVVNIPTPTFTWQATTDSVGGSGLRKYQLVIDGAVNIDSIPPNQTSSSPAAPLAICSHTWLVRAIDNVGNIRTSNASPRSFIYYSGTIPSTFSLLTPANNDTVSRTAPIAFRWRRSIGGVGDTLRYTLKIKRVPTGIDTSIANLSDTTYSFNWIGVLPASSTYRWWATVRNSCVTIASNDTLRQFYTPSLTGLVEEKIIPTEYRLQQNYPNPFNPSTTIEFALPKSVHATLKIFDLLGREVATLVNETLEAGVYRKDWDASGLSSGIYVYRLAAGDASVGSAQWFVQTKKLLLLR